MALGLAMVDVDGTLMHLADWKPGAAALLGHLDAADIPIALCSGRAVDSLRLSADEWPEIRYIAGGGGSIVQERSTDGWRTLGERFLTPAQVAWVTDAAGRHGMELWAYTNAAWLVAERTDRVTYDESFTGSSPTVAPFVGRDDIAKLLTFVVDDDDAHLLSAVATLDGLAVVSSYPGYWDIIPTASAHTKGGDILTDTLGITWADVLAVGDGPNDLGMLSRAGLALLMPPRTLDELNPAEPWQQRHACADLHDALGLLEGLAV